MKLQELSEKELQETNGGFLLLGLGLGNLLTAAVEGNDNGQITVGANLNLSGLSGLLSGVSNLLGGLLGRL